MTEKTKPIHRVSSSLSRRAVIRFLVTAFLLYVPGFALYNSYLDRTDSSDLLLIRIESAAAAGLLSAVGVEATGNLNGSKKGELAIDGITVVRVAKPCNSLSLLMIFSGFILAYPGTWRHRFLYLVFGNISLFLLNIVRIAMLALVARHYPDSLDFNHKYVFTFLIYSFIFLLWMSYAGRKK